MQNAIETDLVFNCFHNDGEDYNFVGDEVITCYFRDVDDAGDYQSVGTFTAGVGVNQFTWERDASDVGTPSLYKLTFKIIPTSGDADLSIVTEYRVDEVPDGTDTPLPPPNVGVTPAEKDWLTNALAAYPDFASLAFDPAAYGADGDGTDQTTEIHAMLDAVVTAGGGVINLKPNGVYVLDDTKLIETDVYTCFFVPSNTIINGNGATIKRKNESTNNGALQSSVVSQDEPAGVVSIVFRDFIVDGNKANQTSIGANIENIHLYNSSGFYFENIKSINAVHDGYDFDSCTDGVLEKCHAIDCDKSGFHPSTNTTDVVFSSCFSSGNVSATYSTTGGAGFSLVATSTRITLLNCISVNDYNAIRLDGSNNQVIGGSITGFERNALFNYQNVTKCSVSGVFVTVGGVGANHVVSFNAAQSPSKIAISDCIFVKEAGTFTGKVINDLPGQSSVVGCSMHGFNGRAILCEGDRYVEIASNLINSGAYSPIDLSSANNATVVANTFITSSTGRKVRNAGTSPTIKNNNGEVKSDRGLATVPSGSTSIAVSFAATMDESPPDGSIQCTPRDSLGAATNWRIGAVNTAGFTITLDTIPGSNVRFQWLVAEWD